MTISSMTSSMTMSRSRTIPGARRAAAVALFGIALSVAPGVASADENRGTADQQLACTPDVFRYCGSAIPDVDRIVACLRQNTAQLSSPCKAVFDSNASMPPGASATSSAPVRQPRPLSQNAH